MSGDSVTRSEPEREQHGAAAKVVDGDANLKINTALGQYCDGHSQSVHRLPPLARLGGPNGEGDPKQRRDCQCLFHDSVRHRGWSQSSCRAMRRSYPHAHDMADDMWLYTGKWRAWGPGEFTLPQNV